MLFNGQIAGLTDFGQGFNGAPDVLAGRNSSFGEFAVDVRVSAWEGWIDTVVDIVAPTAPGSLDLLERRAAAADRKEHVGVGIAASRALAPRSDVPIMSADPGQCHLVPFLVPEGRSVRCTGCPRRLP